MKQCLITCGPESSGNHLITNLLISWGCFGEAGGEQYLDRPDWSEVVNENLVWLRSLPHGGYWPNFETMTLQARTFGYQPKFVIVVRSKIPTVQSQRREGRVTSDEEATFKIAYALGKVCQFVWAHHVPYEIVTYEGLVYSEPLRRALCDSLGLKWSDEVRVRDENLKYFESYVSS